MKGKRVVVNVEWRDEDRAELRLIFALRDLWDSVYLFGDGVHVNLQLTRKDLEELAEDILELATTRVENPI